MKSIKIANLFEILRIFKMENDTDEVFSVLGKNCSKLLMLYERTNAVLTGIFGKFAPFQNILFVVKDENHIIGFGSVKMIKHNKTAELGLLIKKDFRNRGYGKALLLEMIIFARLNSYKAILSVKENNKIALEMYKKAGFMETDKILQMESDSK